MFPLLIPNNSGLMSYSGTKADNPVLTGMQIADVASGFNNVIIEILAAVLYRNNAGKGQHIDISMMDGVVPFNAMTGAGTIVNGIDSVKARVRKIIKTKDPERMGRVF